MKLPAASTIALSGMTALLLGIALTGCSQQDTASSAQQQQAARLLEITKKTGGDWNKLTPNDRQYLIQEIGKGDQGIARSALEMNMPRHPRQGPPNASMPGHIPSRPTGST